MPPKFITPAISLKSFSCPHCGALADQNWLTVGASRIKDDGLPSIISMAWVDERVNDQQFAPTLKPPQREEIFEGWRRRARGEQYLEELSDARYDRYELYNIHISECYSCKKIALWKYDTLFFPREKHSVEANADLNDDIQRDFDEARSVLDISPRAAAALLRLCIQKLCVQIGLPGKNINADIGELVAKGLKPQIQKALDVVRVVGNSAVHPGELDLRDDRETAVKLFELVNRIAYDVITHPKEVDALYANLPPNKLDAIAVRDGSNAS